MPKTNWPPRDQSTLEHWHFLSSSLCASKPPIVLPLPDAHKPSAIDLISRQAAEQPGQDSRQNTRGGRKKKIRKLNLATPLCPAAAEHPPKAPFAPRPVSSKILDKRRPIHSPQADTDTTRQP
ncbi:hypothetical protein CPLU01_04535 [Colletotrichum plurivorum]|uniref:Uncharacterized protein n=1 Tax=Colletotrichum plurivorum TaxID=2175906 RepID=A0A8H6KP16_9PEZI|nr:hypothetical protein CPLU01_04535 [Colletotrichum plurivorum]